MVAEAKVIVCVSNRWMDRVNMSIYRLAPSLHLEVSFDGDDDRLNAVNARKESTDWRKSNLPPKCFNAQFPLLLNPPCFCLPHTNTWIPLSDQQSPPLQTAGQFYPPTPPPPWISPRKPQQTWSIFSPYSPSSIKENPFLGLEEDAEERPRRERNSICAALCVRHI